MLALRTDQVARLAHYISQPRCLDLSDPGTGKTPPVCINQFRRWQDSQLPTVWVQPKALMFKNKQEICRWTPFTSDDVVIVDGPKSKKLAQSGAKVLLMGPDRFKSIYGDIPSEYKALDCDEFHMCFGGAGTPNLSGGYVPSQRVQAFYSYPMVEGVFMTGTLINGRLDTAYPAIHKIEPNYYPFGYAQFLGCHAHLDENLRPFAWHSHGRLRDILGRHGIRFTFEQIFGEQEVVREVQWVEMNPKQRAIYDQFEQTALLELEDFMVYGTSPGVATIRARQIMEHPNRFPDLRDPENLPPVDIMPGERPAKLDALEIDFEDQLRRGEPIIVFAALVPQHEQIAELAAKMGLRAGVMNGNTSAKKRKAIDEAFIAGELDVIVGSPPVCAIGFNWQFWGPKMVEVDQVVFSSLTYMDSDFIQGYRRAVRGKRSRPLRVKTQAYYGAAVEMKVMNILERKSRDANLVDPTREILRFSDH